MLEIAYRPLKGLAAYGKNSRTHSAASITKIMGSLAEFGWTNSPLIADGVIICGHARITAAIQMAEAGIPIPGNPDPWQCPTVDISHLSGHQRAAYVISDNRLSLDAGWDQELLAEELGWLGEDGFNIDVIGFEEDELASLLGGVAPGDGPDPDDIPETPLHPVTRPGDCWIMGRHRLVCGDSTNPDTVNLALGGVKPHLAVTDPPNGVDYDPEDRGKARNANGKPLSTGGRRAITKEVSRSNWREAFDLFPGDVAYVWHAAINPAASQKMLEDAGFEIRMQIIWAKSALVVGRGHYHMQHEPCWYAVRKGKTAHWKGDRKQSTLWQIEKSPKNTTGQSTEKPVDCMLRPIENNSSPGQAVYDPFVGSFTTGIACEMAGRACLAIELDPATCDVAVKRWQLFAAQDAVLEETGRTFAEMAMERPYGEAAA